MENENQGSPLRECPFCPDGGRPYIGKLMGNVRCDSCGASALVDRWNTRTDASLLAERDRLREVLRDLGEYAASLEMMLNLSNEGKPLTAARAALAKGENNER